MKKLFAILMILVLCTSLFACNSTAVTTSTKYIPDYERLVYSVTESGSTSAGTLTLTSKRIKGTQDYTIQTIDENGAIIDVPLVVDNNAFILEGHLEFNGDVIDYKMVTNSGFRPLYSYKSLKVLAEQTAWNKETQEPACVSYVMTTTYEEGENKAFSRFLRQKKYGSSEMNLGEMDFEDLPSNTNTTYIDINQMYYFIRCLSNLHEDDFRYTFYMPMALESNTKFLICNGKPNQSKSLENFPYIKEIYANDENFALTYTAVTITPSGEPVTGASLSVYYAEQSIHSRNQLDHTKDGLCDRLPILIVENQRATTIDTKDRGTITYSLMDVYTEE